jgi:hypothetical protein
VLCFFCTNDVAPIVFYIGCVVGLFFVIPCIEAYTKVDLRTVTFDVPPQEVSVRGRNRRKVKLCQGKNCEMLK